METQTKYKSFSQANSQHTSNQRFLPTYQHSLSTHLKSEKTNNNDSQSYITSRESFETNQIHLHTQILSRNKPLRIHRVPCINKRENNNSF